MNINTLVEAPHGLEVVLHPLPQLLWDLVQGEEVLQISPFRLVQGPPQVHPLDD